jgi:exportin-1
MSKTPKVRQLRALKKDILKLTQTYINSVIQIEVVNENFIPPPLDAVLGDYQRRAGGGGAGVGANINTVALPAASREAEMLNLMSNVVRCLGVSDIDDPV